ncbi:ufm1-specific protease 1 [Pseudomyrmex gracilis]|uniref:ufm1-specific protease 1 n=1 Tax=Pseudomyrmex gracilis TaxID=219809 RepID=UPI0009956551|nr:ufm1-specific protease 1 [Pseudomyrmex gracilis]
MSYKLLTNVHKDIPVPDNGQTFLIKGNYEYWHHCCDTFNDRGWGCGYRTLQTICSWFIHNKHMVNDDKIVPTVNKIQRIIDEVGDKTSTFVETRNWIGTFEAFLVLNHLYNASCKIIHIWKGIEALKAQTDTIKNHFTEFGSPIMMGGDKDISSKCIVGIHFGDVCTYLLIVDPHFVGKAETVEDLKKRNWVKWQNLDDFDDSSFYNLCLPQVKCDITK